MREPNADFLEATLWKQVTPEPNTGCWFWAGSLSSLEEPILVADGETHLARSVAWGSLRGESPAPTATSCNQKSCVNPAHMVADGSHNR